MTQPNSAFSDELKRICTDVFEATGHKLDETDPATVAALFYSRALRAASQDVAQSMDGFWLDVQVRLQKSFQAASADLKKSCDDHVRSAIDEVVEARWSVSKDCVPHDATARILLRTILSLPWNHRIYIATGAASICLLLAFAGFGAGVIAAKTLF